MLRMNSRSRVNVRERFSIGLFCLVKLMEGDIATSEKASFDVFLKTNPVWIVFLRVSPEGLCHLFEHFLAFVATLLPGISKGCFRAYPGVRRRMALISQE